jgi:hypothetical protein
MKYRKKPVVIEAVKWDGQNVTEVKKFGNGDLIVEIDDLAWQVGKAAPVVTVLIKTLEGEMKANVGDFIIRGVNGEVYPCKPDIFEKTYEIVWESEEI